MLPDDPNLPRWQPVAIALATGATVADAAAAGGVHPSTVKRWLRRPAFNHRIQEVRDQAISAAVGKLSEACISAAETLRELLSNSNPVVRLGAARALLYSALKGREAVDADNRIRELEDLAAKPEARRGETERWS
jgi:HEAT repeat protein